MSFRRSVAVTGLAFVTLGMSASPAFAGKAERKLLEEVMAYASQPDVVLVPPSGELSPGLGSFVVPYEPPAGGVPDPQLVGTYESAPSSCSESLTFREVSGAESRQQLWATETGVGFSIGLPMIEIGGSWGHKSIAGMEYHLTRKMILDGGLRELEECCLRSPERCTNHYISEGWEGTGRIHRLVTTKAGLKPLVRQLQGTGSVDFSNSSSFSMSSEWSQPQFFAYRTTAFQLPSCESYMNSLPEENGLVLFSGVSERADSERDARRDARDDARRQVVEYLGQEYSIAGGEAMSRAESVISGVKDSLTCLDPVMESASGPRYLARVRMYIEAEALNGGLAGNASRLDGVEGEEPEAPPTAPQRPTNRRR